ncbi:MAG: N-acetyl-gamma-glutamyl-phosphate reductase [Polyangiaceae bacterium]|nr:N-acetyl-gamma-glutamyl-phosphate reductase [Polyangiaceae bacterium]MCW5788990.1 N-acetyl-gamma-glutamyl-phosphate reductase [Polyangiaceae bacterium]
MTDLMRAGIIGAGGYTGAELVRLIGAHPKLELRWVAGHESAGRRLSEVLPGTLGVQGVGSLTLERYSAERAAELASALDVVFCCLPHGKSAAVVASLYQAGLTVVDLSADFRTQSQAAYEAWYGPHPAPELLPEAVYGLPERYRRELAGARLIAAPGCYPTSAILPLAPLFAAGLVDVSAPVVIDAKSGVSGAGRSPSASTHYPEAAEGLRAYKVAGAHRHTGEIEQQLERAAGAPVSVLFTPHLVPMSRGILSSSYVKLTSGASLADCREAARAAYPEGGLVTLLEESLPDTLWVRGTARAHISYQRDERTGLLLALCAIDNLTRGASGQALQALNVAFGWDEALGLPVLGQFP